ncbi:hypothetical protein HDE_07851 [Halotydeus destructor]|nr:hypothetical protein HDE_07851 [Halotydeus destructor]
MATSESRGGSSSGPMADQSRPKNRVQDDEDDPSSGTTESADNINDGHDMMSSYTAISFDSSDEEELDLGDLERDRTPVVFSDPDSSVRGAAGSLSLPQLTSTIISWSERAAADLDNIDNQDTRPSTTDILDGSLAEEPTGMVSFVADDLEEKLRLSAPSSPKSNSVASDRPSHVRSSTPSSVQLDMRFLEQLEQQTQQLNDNINGLVADISKSTHTISKLAVDCTHLYQETIDKTCDSVDGNIRSMYYLMSKVEELNKSMKPIDAIVEDVNQVKKVLDMFERVVI